MSKEPAQSLETFMFEGDLRDVSARPEHLGSKKLVFTLTIQIDPKDGPALFEATHKRSIRGRVHCAVNIAT